MWLVNGNALRFSSTNTWSYGTPHVHSSQFLPPFHGHQIGFRFVWEDNRTHLIDRQTIVSKCIGQTGIHSLLAMLNELECMAHPLAIDQHRTLRHSSFDSNP